MQRKGHPVLRVFFNWDSLHTRLNSHYKARSYKKKKDKKRKEESTAKRCLPIRSLVKGKHSIGREFQSSCARNEMVDIDVLETSRKSGRKIMQSIRITSRLSLRKRKWDQLSQFWRTSTKIPHFHNEASVQEKQQVKGQQSCILICLFVGKSMGTETTKWSEFHSGEKDIVEQIIVSEEINKSKRASLWESGI